MFIKIMNSSLNLVFGIPTPLSINLFWNFGSLIGLFMLMQVLTGWFLSMHYVGFADLSFIFYKKLSQDVYSGWLLQIFHMNFASFLFAFVFFHIFKGLIYNSFYKKKVWFSGFFMFILLMVSAFVGYVLPWGQMSFWGATVITNIFSAIPYVGILIVSWFWGNFSVSSETLNRFFSFHFLFPLLIMGLIFLHFFFLHESGSSNQLGLVSDKDKLNFDKSFLSKDALSFFFVLFSYMLVIFLFFSCHYMMSKENFMEVDPLNTPSHIKPEWYFMFAYSILRCVPSKIGGIFSLAFLFLLLFFLPFKFSLGVFKFKVLKKFISLMVFFFFFFLTCMGYKEIEEPFIIFTQFSSFLFCFFLFFV